MTFPIVVKGGSVHAKKVQSILHNVWPLKVSVFLRYKREMARRYFFNINNIFIRQPLAVPRKKKPGQYTAAEHWPGLFFLNVDLGRGALATPEPPLLYLPCSSHLIGFQFLRILFLLGRCRNAPQRPRRLNLDNISKRSFHSFFGVFLDYRLTNFSPRKSFASFTQKTTGLYSQMPFIALTSIIF